MNRLHQLRGTTFDLIIIGGGIIGAGIARDAALRGLKVALFEKSDFGGGTTSASTRIIHGGLRYLEMFDFRLVRMDLREREILLRIAPHLVKPLDFLLPFYDSGLFHRTKMKVGMMLYDMLSYDKSLPNHRLLSPADIETLEPHLKKDGLRGAVLYSDAQVDSPERLCLENIIDARRHDACTLNDAEVTGALRSGETVEGVAVRDLTSGEELEVKGRMVVNATGPWFDRMAGVLTSHTQKRVRPTKGIHIICPALSQRALVLFSGVDQRLFFVIPWLGHSLIGTTDTDFSEDPAQARATGTDVQYLLESLEGFFPHEDSQIYFSSAGVRALLKWRPWNPISKRTAYEEPSFTRMPRWIHRKDCAWKISLTHAGTTPAHSMMLRSPGRFAPVRPWKEWRFETLQAAKSWRSKGAWWSTPPVPGLTGWLEF